MGEELVWSWKESELFQQWFLYSADLKFAAAVTSHPIQGEFRYALEKLATLDACPVETIEEAKRFVEAQYILMRGE